MNISFCHVLNPFPSKEDSEHGIASRITFATMRTAVDKARVAGIMVDVNAVILPGDEAAVEQPASVAGYLSRTVQDIKSLTPNRPYPLIIDILSTGVKDSKASHVIYTNMDISLRPDFYICLVDLIEHRFRPNTPFIVYRRNLSSHYKGVEDIPEMLKEDGQIAYGYDCFVFPRSYVEELDLGNCCIAAGHFDYLLFIALDAISGFRVERVSDKSLTLHIGNNVSWSGQIDYLEHNLDESLAAIRRMRERYEVPKTSSFRRLERKHFEPNARLDSRILRKLKRIPLVGRLVFLVKRWLGKSH